MILDRTHCSFSCTLRPLHGSGAWLGPSRVPLKHADMMQCSSSRSKSRIAPSAISCALFTSAIIFDKTTFSWVAVEM